MHARTLHTEEREIRERERERGREGERGGIIIIHQYKYVYYPANKNTNAPISFSTVLYFMYYTLWYAHTKEHISRIL